MATSPLLSACLIVRDEEEHLPWCLASLEGLADEVVVVDTDTAETRHHLAFAVHEILPSASLDCVGVPELTPFRASIPGLHAPLSTLHLRSHDRRRMTRGRA